MHIRNVTTFGLFNLILCLNLICKEPKRAGIPNQKKSFTTIKQAFEKQHAWGMETIIDVHACDPELIRSEAAIRDYVHQLCTLIDMNPFGETVVVHFGQDEKVAGYSMMQLIETSLISGHFANKTNNVYINIFSCKPYDPYAAAAFTSQFFKGTDHNYHIVLRK